jgi:hypothetical protein
MKEKVKQWLGDNIIYDAHGQMIFAVRENGHHQMIADVRGWGAIQNLFPGDPSKAMEFQDALGEFLAEAIKKHISSNADDMLKTHKLIPFNEYGELYRDKKRLDKLQELTQGYGKGWMLRDSSTGRGMRLHETELEGAVPNVREAIDNYKED